MIPKPNDLITFLGEVIRTQEIIYRISRMLSAIHFDDQSSFKATKIGNIFSYGVLSAKFKTGKLSVSKM